MRLATLFGSRITPPADGPVGDDGWPADAGSLYDVWAADPAQAAASLPQSCGFTAAEANAAALWSARQRDWGLHARMSRCQGVLEVFGPDELVAHCILYPAADGIQSDEFSGASMVYPCLESALQAIAPLH